MGKDIVSCNRGKVRIIPVDSIVYLENAKRKVFVHTLDGNYEFYGHLTDTIKELDERFYLCHRSYCINMSFVEYMENQSIHFVDKSVIYLGRTTFLQTKKKVIEYFKQNNENIH